MTPADLSFNNLSAVTHPSAKVLLWERADFGQHIDGGSPAWNDPRARTDIFLVDGSSDEVRIADLEKQIHNGNSELLPVEVLSMGAAGPLATGDVPDQPHTSWPPPTPPPPAYFWATRGGVGGRDIAR